MGSYSELCGLWANIDRYRCQQAAAFMIGYAAAKSTKSLDDAFFDGLAKFKEEASQLAFDVNAARATQAAVNKMGTR